MASQLDKVNYIPKPVVEASENRTRIMTPVSWGMLWHICLRNSQYRYCWGAESRFL